MVTIFFSGRYSIPPRISPAAVRLYPKSQIAEGQLFEKLENGVNDIGVWEHSG